MILTADVAVITLNRKPRASGDDPLIVRALSLFVV